MATGFGDRDLPFALLGVGGTEGCRIKCRGGVPSRW